jgi:hypothetical protein
MIMGFQGWPKIATKTPQGAVATCGDFGFKV